MATQTIRRRPNGRRTYSEGEPSTSPNSNTAISSVMPNFFQPDVKIDTTAGTEIKPPCSIPKFNNTSNADLDPVNTIPQKDLLMAPVVTANTDESKAMDDSFIRRLSLGAYADLEQNSAQNMSTRTTPRRPPEAGKYYLCPSNTFVASNGEVYHVDPFQLPPPSEIAELFQEINQRRVNSKQSPLNATSPMATSVGSGGESAGGGEDSRSIVNKKYPSLPAEWMRTPRTSLRDEESSKKEAAAPKTRRRRRKSFSRHGSDDDDSDPEEEEDEPFNFKKFSWRKFILAEMLGIGLPAGPTEPVAAESIDNFLSVPYKLECLVMFGCFVAMDSFLYVITYLPIRFCFAVYVFLDEAVMPRSLKMTADAGDAISGWDWRFPRNRLYDFMRGLLLLVGCYALSLVDMSRVYHYIRMQNTLKLYALTGMMEIIDKLLCSFGIDVLDSLFVKSQQSSRGTSAVSTFIVAAVYVVIHSSLYFLHMATLTVAINNQDQSLITVLILNNFAEIKSSVLKKFDSGNLFQLACSDISERFKMFLFYTLIMVVGLAQARDVEESFQSFAAILLAMIACEMTVDWIKHAFITKFNAIKSHCYVDYSRALRNDILNGHNDKITLDHSYTITKRLGMSQIPLGVVFFKFFAIGLSSTRMTAMLAGMTVGQIFCYGLACFSFALVFKVFLAVSLIYYTAHMNNQEKVQEKTEQKKRNRAARHRKKEHRDNHVKRSSDLGSGQGTHGISSNSGSPEIVDTSAERRKSVEALSNIERYTMLRGRINA